MTISKQLQSKIALENKLTRNYRIFLKKEKNIIFKELFYFENKYEDRKKAYQRHLEKIKKQKSLFKKIISLRKDIVEKDAEKDFFDLMLKQKGVPESEFKFFLKNYQKIVNETNHMVTFPTNLPKWYWSSLSIPNPLVYLSTPAYQLPDDIYKIMRGIIPSFETYIPKIKIIPIGRYSQSLCRFKKDTKTVEIEKDMDSKSLLNATSFVHEVGHAIHFLECFKNNIDPSFLSTYEKELKAYDLEYKFEKYALKKNVRNALRWINLGNFALALFEQEIYNNPEQNFDELLANLENQIQPQKKEKNNPFYILKSTFIESPLDVVVSSVVQAKLLL